jgi:hypothetical protein
MPDNFIRALVTQAFNWPVSTLFGLCALLVVAVRVRTGQAQSRRQSETSAAEKEIQILPYWLPYIGHAPEVAWSLPGLLAKGR